jgi:hypothetical protein
MIAQLPEEQWSELRFAFLGAAGVGVQISVHRGLLEEAERTVGLLGDFGASADHQERGTYSWGAARLALARGDAERALRLARDAWASRDSAGLGFESAKEGFVVGVEAALKLGDLAAVEELLTVVEGLPLGRQPQFLRAQASRFRGHLAALRDEPEEAERRFKGAVGLFRELAVPFYLAVTELEHGEWLTGQRRAAEAEPLLAEAHVIFEGLAAAPWLERCGAVSETALA